MIRTETFRVVALSGVLLTLSGATIARAEETPKPNAVANQNGDEGDLALQSAHLLPCPKSVPCLASTFVPATGNYGETYSGAQYPPNVAASGRLLPCPHSVPCLTVGPNTDSSSERKALTPRPNGWRFTALPRARSTRTSGIAIRKKDFRRPAVPAAAGARMAMQNDDAYEEQARKLLSEVHRDLGNVDHARLSQERLLAYAKANDLINETSRALRANDNLAALAFVEKARLLAASFREGSSSDPGTLSGKERPDSAAFPW